MRKFILLLSFSRWTALHVSAANRRLEVTRLLVESKADVAARRCFSPPPSHHLSLTICLAAGAALHSITPSSTNIITFPHTCAASARHVGCRRLEMIEEGEKPGVYSWGNVWYDGPSHSPIIGTRTMRRL